MPITAPAATCWWPWLRRPTSSAASVDTLQRVDALEWQLRQVEGVESTNSLPLLNREIVGSYNEGSM